MNKVGTKLARQIIALIPGVEWDERWLGIRWAPIKRRRSTEQNALYWVHVNALAQFSGDTAAGIHEALLCELHGYDTVELPNGMVRMVPRGRSHDQDTDNFSRLIEIVQKWCIDMGVPVNTGAA